MEKQLDSPTQVAKRIAKRPVQTHLRDFVYGGIDGSVTSFAVVSGVMGAKLSVIVILILGLAKLFADAFSMAGANFLSTRTEIDELKYFKALEHQQIKDMPDEEIEEIKQIFIKKGFKGEDLKKIVGHVTSHEKLWVDTMLAEEYGLCAVIRSPWKSSFNAFLSFIICGFLPLIPFIFNLQKAFLFSFIFACFAFFLIGSLKSKWATKSWFILGMETLVVGVTAAGISYFIADLCDKFLV